MTSMTILHITPSYFPALLYGGPTLSVSRLCEAQARAGAQLRVLTTTANGPGELGVSRGKPQLVNGVEVFYFSRLTKDHTHFSPALLWQVWKQCRGWDVVHIHSWWNLVAVLSFLICRLRGVLPVLSPRGMLSPYSKDSGKSLLKTAVMRFAKKQLEQGAVLHFTSRQEQAKSLVKGGSFILPNIVDLPSLLSFEEKENQAFQLCFLGRINPVKGLELLFGSLSGLTIPWQLEIVGEGEEDYTLSLKRLASQLGIFDRLTWSGWLSGEPKFGRIRSAGLLVLPSLHENFANVVIESLSVGTPVLLSDQVGLCDYVLEKDLGWVTPLDVAQIALALENAFRDEAKRRRIREQAPRLIRRDFEEREVAVGYFKAYQRFCPTPGIRAPERPLLGDTPFQEGKR